MEDFIIRFLLCNVLLCVIVGILLTVRRLLQNRLSARTQYRLWFLLLGLLAVPFIPLRPARFPHVFSWLTILRNVSAADQKAAAAASPAFSPSDATAWIQDFGISVSEKTPSGIGLALCAIWLAGIAGTLVFLTKSAIRFHRIKKSALPLQNPVVRSLYQDCLTEMHITKEIPVYSTAFLTAPAIAGLLKPRIYLPVHLISDCHTGEIRYMLLHELQHYRHKDAFIHCAGNLAGVLYWFNPFIWYALKEMKTDREVACDTSVLEMLEENACRDYGNTLINFAEKISRPAFPSAMGIGGTMAQIRKRILNIASYRPASPRQKLYGSVSYALTAVLLAGFIPALSIQAVDHDHYSFRKQGKTIINPDLQNCFADTEGCFVLYDTAADAWTIYHEEAALTRIAPVSTYKPYSALFALESGIIAPQRSLLPWDGQHHRYDLWNADQTLESAMQHSVTWYFQELDRQTGSAAIRDYLRQTGYGNQNVGGDLSSYWIDSSLKISPVEQVELLQKFHDNQFGFSQEAVDTVKNAIRLSTDGDGVLYGKTGTQEVNGQNVSGWFIGYIEKSGQTCFFAANIQDKKNATGAAAARLTLTILSDLGYWNPARAADA